MVKRLADDHSVPFSRRRNFSQHGFDVAVIKFQRQGLGLDQMPAKQAKRKHIPFERCRVKTCAVLVLG
ncbi:hypothetical protein D3C85_1440690 [compost metagenome]